MDLNEVVKSFFKKEKKEELSSKVDKEKVLTDLTNYDKHLNTGSFFDDATNLSSITQGYENISILYKQKEKIQKYRKLAMMPDVSEAIDEIVNEIIFSYDDTTPIKIDINEENKKLVDAITDKFKKILKLINIERNLYKIVKNGYIDGQIILHLAYDKKNVKNGIKAIKMIDPIMFYFDPKENVYKYAKGYSNLYIEENEGEKNYSVEEICREDFGLYENNLVLGYLEYAIKPANILKTLEDLLIPLRFSRSISRRVFNVDVGDLPVKRAAEVMREYQNKFKYKKFYNNETGEVTNQQHITSMVEDYWFANRSGGRGTTVETLDESGNLGELDDILYFNRKLYRALKIPSNRISINPEGDKDFNYDDTSISKEDIKFFMFISRLRQVYTSLFKEVLKREVISTGIMSYDEWEEKEDLINISFVNENKFIEKMKLDIFTRKLEIYSTVQEYQGKLFSIETILKKVFKFTDEEIREEFEKIKKEEENPLYSKFYNKDDDNSDAW